MIVPAVTLPGVDSAYVGPVNAMDPPPVLSAEIVDPPVAGVTVPVPPGFTVTEELTSGVFPPSVTSEAVIVAAPAVLSVMLNVCEPATRALFAGSVAVPSLDVIATTSVTVLTGFQFASTALTVNVKPD